MPHSISAGFEPVSQWIVLNPAQFPERIRMDSLLFFVAYRRSPVSGAGRAYVAATVRRMKVWG